MVRANVVKFKRVIAREWLLFLLLLFVSPAIVSVYHWMRAPKAPEDIPEEHPRLYDLLITVPGYDAQLLVAPNLPKGKRDQEILEFVEKHPLKEPYKLPEPINPRTGKPYEITLVSPKVGLTQIGEFIDGGYLSADDRVVLNYIKTNGFLIFRKRSLIAYLADAIKNKNYFEPIIIIYPLFLFIRSIVWSIRNLRRREA
jgi:hypothetical protein